MIRIEEVNPSEFPTLFHLVKELLLELGDEASDIGNMDDHLLLKELGSHGERHIAYFARTDANEIVGMITVAEGVAIYAGGRYGVINETYVVPRFRSQAVGRQLVEKVKELGRQRAWKRVDVTAPTGERWKKSSRFYEREGFMFTGPKLKFNL